MVQEKMYRYLGRNGTVTTPIKLEKIDPIIMIHLKAAQGKILTDGISKTYAVIVFEDEVENWIEIDDEGQD